LQDLFGVKTMRSYGYYMIVASLICVAQVGCGTLHNLHAPPVEQRGFDGTLGSGSGICVPFGGVARSGLMGLVYAPAGISELINGELGIIQRDSASEGIARIGNGMVMTATGLVALMDTPLSLAGDVVSLPIAIARHQEQPWATWWGKDGETCWLPALPWFCPTSEEKAHTQKEIVQQD
jgi:hypothetical protein